MQIKILIVEDEAITAMDIQNRLNNRGLEVVGIASRGKEAIKKAGELNPDIILMDITLKGDMDGIEAAEEINFLFNIPVIYMSAFTDENTFEKIKSSSPYGFVNKPVSSELLLVSIEAAVYKHEMDKRLILSEEKYRRIVETTTEGIWEMDSEYVTKNVNPAMATMLGYTVEEMIGKPIPYFLFKEDLMEYAGRMGKRKEGLNGKYETRLKHKNGSTVWVLVSATSTVDENGNYNGSFAMFVDISERKKAEESMRMDKERLKLAQIAAGAGLWDWNIKTEHIKWSKLMFELFGLDPKKNKASFEAWDKALHPEDLEIAHKRIETAIEEHKLLDSEYRIVLPDGQVRWINALGKAEYDDQDAPISMIGFCIDITERKKSEEALKQSQWELNESQRVTKTGNWSFDILNGNIKWSDELYRIFEVQKSEFDYEYETFISFVHPEDRKLVKETNKNAREKGSEFKLEYRILTPHGEKFIREIGYSIKNDSGEVVMLFGTAQDFTEIKKAEEHFSKEVERESFLLELYKKSSQLEDKELYDSALDHAVSLTDSSVGFFHLISDDQKTIIITTWNSEALNSCTASFKTHYPVEQAGNWTDCIQAKGPVVYNDFEKSPNRQGFPEGHTPVKRFMSIPVFDGDKVKFIFGVGNKIGEYDDYDVIQIQAVANELYRIIKQRRSEQVLKLSHDNLEIKVKERTKELEKAYNELIERKAQLRIAMDLAEIVSWQYDVESDIFTFDDQFYRLYGTTAEKEGGTLMSSEEYVRRFLPPEEASSVREEIAKAVETDDPNFTENVEHTIIRADGEERCINVHFGIIKDENGKTIRTYGANQDITERKKSEEQLNQIIKELERSNEELEQFAYISSHDLQEPLRTIASFTQLIERRYKGKLDSDADEFMDYIVEAAIRMKEQIEGLLEYSRVATKGEEFEQVDMNATLNQTVGILSMTINESNAKITYDKLPWVMGDSRQLQRVFQNLISNAIKFRKEEEPLKIHISSHRDDDNEFVFSIKDNGIGIEEQYSERIFTIFQRLHTRDVYKGTGIGLSVVKRIIERHGGRVWVESEFGVGSTFYFTLPIEQLKLGGGILTNSN